MGKYNTTLLRTESYKLGEIEFTLTELSGKDMKSLMKHKFSDEDSLTGMIFLTLKQTDKDITMEDIDDLPLSIYSEIATIVSKLNSKE